MIAFYAAQTFVDRAVGISLDGDGSISGNPNQKAAAGATESARRFFPFNPA
jgi:hypothetical protein